MTTLLTSIVRGPGGSQRTSRIQVPPFGTQNGTAAWPSANRGYFVKVRFDKPTTVTGMSFPTNTASGNAKMGLYSSDGTTLTQLALTASTAIALVGGAAGFQDINLLASVPVSPFVDYFAFAAADNGSAQVYRLALAAAGFSDGEAYEVNTAFVTPPTPQAISGLTATVFVPIMKLLVSG